MREATLTVSPHRSNAIRVCPITPPQATPVWIDPDLQRDVELDRELPRGVDEVQGQGGDDIGMIVQRLGAPAAIM